MQCPNCQHWNEPGARFCEECGIELPLEQDVAQQVSVRATPPPAPASDAPVVADVLDIPQQDLVPIESSPAQPYTGARLVLQQTGSIFRLGSTATIGREDPTLQIDLEGYPDGKYISQRHAQVVQINGKHYIEDLGSSNHTYVNDIRLSQGQSEPLDEGDVVRLGKLELVFHAEQA